MNIDFLFLSHSLPSSWQELNIHKHKDVTENTPHKWKLICWLQLMLSQHYSCSDLKNTTAALISISLNRKISVICICETII